MLPLVGLMNYVDQMTIDDSFVKRSICTRAIMLGGCLPLELLVVAIKTLQLPFEAVKVVVKLPSKIINVFIRSATLDEFENSLPGPLEFLKKILKVADYAIGTFVTLFWGGVINPDHCFKYHVYRGLIEDDKKIEAGRLKEEQKLSLKRTQKAAKIDDFKNIIQSEKTRVERAERNIEQELAEKDKIEIVVVNQADHPLEPFLCPSPDSDVAAIPPDIIKDDSGLSLLSAEAGGKLAISLSGL